MVMKQVNSKLFGWLLVGAMLFASMGVFSVFGLSQGTQPEVIQLADGGNELGGG